MCSIASSGKTYRDRYADGTYVYRLLAFDRQIAQHKPERRAPFAVQDGCYRFRANTQSRHMKSAGASSMP